MFTALFSLAVAALPHALLGATELPAATEEAVAQSAPAPEPRGDDDDRPLFSWSGARVGQGVELETSVLFPAYPGLLFQLRTTIPVAAEGRGQLLVGAQGHVPQQRDDEGKFSSLAATLGYRHYLWGGLHAELLVNGGYGGLRDSVVDGRDYASFDLEVMALAGWRFELGRAYALVQPLGLASVVYRSNPWPIVGEGTQTAEKPIYVGNVLLGVQF